MLKLMKLMKLFQLVLIQFISFISVLIQFESIDISNLKTEFMRNQSIDPTQTNSKAYSYANWDEVREVLIKDLIGKNKQEKKRFRLHKKKYCLQGEAIKIRSSGAIVLENDDAIAKAIWKSHNQLHMGINQLRKICSIIFSTTSEKLLQNWLEYGANQIGTFIR